MGVAPPVRTVRPKASDTPARPTQNIGMKTPFMPMKVSQKWSLPSVSFMRRPVAFGNQ